MPPFSCQTNSSAAEADQKLLLAIITTHSIQVDFAGVANALGNVCTPRAVQERLKKLKKLKETVAVTVSGDENDAPVARVKKAPAPKKPRKSIAATGTTRNGKKNDGAGKGKVKKSLDDEEGDANEDEGAGEEKAMESLDEEEADEEIEREPKRKRDVRYDDYAEHWLKKGNRYEKILKVEIPVCPNEGEYDSEATVESNWRPKNND